MATGICKWFDARKGFGFLVGPNGEDIFVHYTVIDGEGFRRLVDGEPVEYEYDVGPKGCLATRVRRLDPPAETGAPPANTPQ